MSRRHQRQPERFPINAQYINHGRLVVAGAGAGDGGDAPTGPIVVSGQAVPWGVTVTLNWWGDTFEFARGALDPPTAGRVPFLLDHRPHPMGFGSTFTVDDDGLQAVMHVPRDELDDPDTARAMRQMGNGVRTALSVGFVILDADVQQGRDHDHYVVTAGQLMELSSVVVPRFDDARIESIAASNIGGTTMSRPATTLPGLPPAPRSTARPIRLDDDHGDDDDDVDDHGDDDDDGQASGRTTHPAARRPATAGAVAQIPHGGGRRRASADTSLSYVARILASTGGDPRMVRAALNDITTTDVPGLVRPQYIDELLGLLRLGTPAINVFRQANLTSNPVVYPKWTTLPVVDKVPAGEKIQIPTGDAVIGSLSLAVDTYAGGNDVSVQTIDWSSPDFIEAYFQAATEVYGRRIEAVFETALVTWATSLGVGPFNDLVAIIGAMIGLVAGAGLPGSLVLLVSGDVFGSMFVELAGKGPGLFGAVSADFPTPRVVVGPFLPAGTVIGAMSGAVVSFQNSASPVRLRAVDVNLLGVDVGVYGYFAAGVLEQGALYKATYTAPAGALLGADLPSAWDLSALGGGDMLHGDPPQFANAIPAKSSSKSSS